MCMMHAFCKAFGVGGSLCFLIDLMGSISIPGFLSFPFGARALLCEKLYMFEVTARLLITSFEVSRFLVLYCLFFLFRNTPNSGTAVEGAVSVASDVVFVPSKALKSQGLSRTSYYLQLYISDQVRTNEGRYFFYFSFSAGTIISK